MVKRTHNKPSRIIDKESLQGAAKAPFHWLRKCKNMTLRIVTGKGKPSREEVWARKYFGFPLPPMDGMQNVTRMRSLYDWVKKFGDPAVGEVLEIGCYRGCSTVFLTKATLLKGFRKISVMDLFTGTDMWKQDFDTYDDTVNKLKQYELNDSVRLIRSHSLKYNWSKSIAVLHLDADHEYSAVRKDIAKYSPFIGKGGITIHPIPA